MNARGRRIVLGVTGSIAAYKAVELLRLLTAAGCDVRVIQTPASREFVGGMTFQALSGNPVFSEMFTGAEESGSPFSHIDLADADLMVVAPATAGTIGKMAAGLADNLLLSTFLAVDCQVVICPAMNHRMLKNPAVQENLATLARRGLEIIYPEAGRLACGEAGAGRLADVNTIFARVQELLGGGYGHDYQDMRVLVTAGGTREPIDAVRHISNRSSGRMGYALAEAALGRGARVTVIAANCGLPRHPDITYIDVETAGQMKEAVHSQVASHDILFMAAAVSDFSVSLPGIEGKIKRSSGYDLKLVPTADILKDIGGSDIFKVGFAAQFGAGDLQQSGLKLEEKGLAMLVVNDISRTDIGFESESNEVTIIRPDRSEVFVGKTSKQGCAQVILDCAREIL
ncbi:MAG: bifunctional phosphopantothenoylcysteine decarboxylase/phosphopantothenate--cysteine ligase CoaBC [Gaiellales bacterium]|nr:MAG: bifunctional phosphopantothenoylcysteine decarboxylase/phosphopantothenate--cysteine ligase CoaBC [Gaiellales bacterium]